MANPRLSLVAPVVVWAALLGTGADLTAVMLSVGAGCAAHPPFVAMIAEAIKALKDRTGSSAPAIAKVTMIERPPVIAVCMSLEH